jgi:hypothetical protein
MDLSKHLWRKKHEAAAVRASAADVRKNLPDFLLITAQVHRVTRQFDLQYYLVFFRPRID